MAKGAFLHDADALTVTVPMTFRKRGGRKLVIAPNGADAWALPRARVDNTMVKAIARAHRWKKQLDSGRYQTVQDLAEAERINPSYIARVLRLTLLAPDIVEAILDGRQPVWMQLDDLLVPFPVEWEAQKLTFLHHKLASRVSPDL
ncbi:MAG: hypothetical protein HXY22_00525 [Alphaproteobacteria bacterium]|nr:hypothetical protein [Alphaproteobacteria bacterium]